MENEKAKAVVQEAPVDVFGEAFARFTSTASEGGASKNLPRRYARFTVDHTLCAPGVFSADFAITIASLTSAAELEATREASADPIALAFAFARLSIVKIGSAVDEEGTHDRRLSSAEREWLWEALAQSGRQLVVSMFSSVLSAGDEAAGKARSSLRVF